MTESLTCPFICSNDFIILLHLRVGHVPGKRRRESGCPALADWPRPAITKHLGKKVILTLNIRNRFRIFKLK